MYDPSVDSRRRAIIDVPTRHLFGLDFANTARIDTIAERLYDTRDQRDESWRCVVTANVDHLVRYRRNRVEADVANHASLVLPDGMPIVWASRLLRGPLAARLTGADLFNALWPRLVANRVPVVMIASRRDVAEQFTAVHPGLRCIVPPMFDIGDTGTVDALIYETTALCAAADARFLIVGLSMPKHHLIAHRLRSAWEGHYGETPTSLLLGQAPDFAVGVVRRAPGWMQHGGLEWFWRLAGDPRRLAKRYLVDDVEFLSIVWKEWRGHLAAA